jgi:hypothetical protein
MPRAYATARDSILISSVRLGGEEGEGGRTDVPALREQDPQEEDHDGHAGTDPSIEHKWCRLIEQSLVSLEKPSVWTACARGDRREAG